jgi:hypothetical protein
LATIKRPGWRTRHFQEAKPSGKLAEREKVLDVEELNRILDPWRMTEPEKETNYRALQM